VPTLANGVNDHEIGDIYRFALQHSKHTVGISWQPIVFTGRIDYEQRLKMRFTTADLARCLEEQTNGQVKMHRDWYSLSFVEPFSKLIEVVSGEPGPAVSCHRHCGTGTYVVVDKDSGEGYPLPKFVDVEGLMERIDGLTHKLSKQKLFKKFSMMRALNDLPDFFEQSEAPPGWSPEQLRDFMSEFADFRQRYPDNEARIRRQEQRDYRYLLMASMHFQDAYNYQIPRVRKCVIHYATPDGKFYPFCTYNCGPDFRTQVEAKFSKPFNASTGKTTAGSHRSVKQGSK
jgi:uncharacterized radical SAM superfamily Fe-S cluster-containing enzyme